MKPEYKIIFTDIDWTIYDHSDNKHVFDLESINALKEAQQKGILVYLCTARTYASVKETGLLDLIKPDGLILCNGALVIKDDEPIFEYLLKQEDYEKVCEVVIKHNLTMLITGSKDRFLIAPKTKEVDYVLKTFYESTPEVKDYHNKHAIAALLFAGEEYDEILKKEFPKDILYFRFHDYGVDILTSPHEKGRGVDFVLDYYHLNKENSIGFGDDVADISMFNSVGTSVALANAKDEVKGSATFVTDNVWDSGVKKALKKLDII